MKKTLKRIASATGPGIITGAADNDPSGIATYSQTGAQFGYQQLWTAVFILPFMVAIQEACGRIGAVNGKGLAALIKEHYSKKVLYPVVLLLLIANIINIGADIGAMAETAHLIIPIHPVYFTLLFTCFMLVSQIFINYENYANLLKWLCLAMIAYPITILIIDTPWKTLFYATFIPHIEFNYQFLFILTGVFGTTISPYMFFWQASHEVEQAKFKKMLHLSGRPFMNSHIMRRLRIENFVGMFLSQFCAWSIIAVTAIVLHTHGMTDIATAADAAKALRPFVQTFQNAGFLSECIFAFGIIGLGLLSVPILAGSAAYAMSEAFDWSHGLGLKFNAAYEFYTVIIIAMLIGISINLLNINPFKLLIYCAVINGLVAIPLIYVIARIANNPKMMGAYKSGILSNVFVWLTFVVIVLIAVALIFDTLKPYL